ncbi:MAG TPA: aldehyde dehydrogenase family protein [Ramlibacter sp.]|nr:aldehyde dehydrogenase family protein [Ramlibacter sp.]
MSSQLAEGRGAPGRPVFSAWIAGAARAPDGVATELVDPATGREWATAYSERGSVDPAVRSAHRAFTSSPWADFTAAERAALLRKLGVLIVAQAEEIGRLESLANGKPRAATLAEVRATAQWYQFYANAIEFHDGHQRTLSRSADALITREPLGVVAAITPFNAAFSLGSWKIAPALAMGNTVVLKPPHTAPASTLLLARLAIEAGFPPGVVNVVIGDADVGQALVAHELVAMVSFTGSTAAARQIGAVALSHLKRFACEAGGKSAHIVFEDADIDSAVIAATQGVFSAAGQTCVAGSRLLVQASIFESFLGRYLASVARLRVGDPAKEGTHVGPIASRQQLERIRQLVAGAVDDGARVVAGGGPVAMPAPHADGFWFAPTVLTDVGPSARIWREEVFGPVVLVHPFQTEDEAIALANDSEYGLAAGFWTRDLGRVRRVARRLQAGTVWVNTYRAIDVRVPFGGYKQSGIGRENGVEALAEFSQVKATVIDHAPAVDPFRKST